MGVPVAECTGQWNMVSKKVITDVLCYASKLRESRKANEEIDLIEKGH
jgi:hypothetical protein